MTPEQFPLDACIAFLNEIVALGVEPSDALGRLQMLRASRPGVGLELVWETDLAGRPRYELLVGNRGEATATLSLVPQDAVPFAMRRAQRRAEAPLVSIDGRRVCIHEAILAIDAIRNDTRVVDRIVDHCVIGRELEREPVEIDARELQQAVDRFRRERDLFDAAETERWLTAHGMTLSDLELALERETAVSILRHRIVGAEAKAKFGADPRRWDRVAIAAFAANDYGHAMACVEALRAGEPWLALAERVLTERTDASRSGRTILYETMRRGQIETLGQYALGDAMFLAAHLQGRGPYVVQVRTIEGALWDESTREAIEQELFTAWLARARASAHVQWSWGPS